MPIRDPELHVLAILGAVGLTAVLIVPTVWLHDADADPNGPILKDMESIEASVAYKAPNAPKQPQKPTHQADPVVKPDGVSHDATKKPDDKPPEHKDTKPAPDQDPLAKFKRPDDDTQVGKAPPGDINGSEMGTPDAVTAGDPYFQQLVLDLGWQSPELARAGVEPPIGCIRMTNDGKIVAIKFKQKGDDDISTLAETALVALQKKRNDHPIEVPTHLIDKLTAKYVCFKFTVKAPS